MITFLFLANKFQASYVTKFYRLNYETKPLTYKLVLYHCAANRAMKYFKTSNRFMEVARVWKKSNQINTATVKPGDHKLSPFILPPSTPPYHPKGLYVWLARSILTPCTHFCLYTRDTLLQAHRHL